MTDHYDWAGGKNRSSLPQCGNIHWLGQQSYQALPQFLAGWDVCLMPFAINVSTRYISPTKVLEYMAKQLPIVSTAIVDIVRHFAGEVAVAETHAEFMAAGEQAMGIGAAERLALAGLMQAKVDTTSWDRTAEQIHGLIQRTAIQCRSLLRRHRRCLWILPGGAAG